MKKIAGFIVCFLITGAAFLQAQDAKTLQETARNFAKEGDYSNAILVLGKAHEQEPDNMGVSKDLALAYFQKSDYPKMQGVLKPLLERPDADAEVYQLGGMLNKVTGDTKECERIYKKGLKNFPDSGPLLNDYGELLWAKQDYTAIKQWERGIRVDPAYTSNYYNAAKYYYFTKDKAWSLIYGELFVNLESFSRRTVEVKNILLEGYKKLFTDADIMKNQDTRNEFAVAFLTNMNKQAVAAKNGITPETLIMIRTRFLLDWFEKDAAKFPFKLFDYQRQLLKEGNFTAYNQWLFGSVQNLAAFENWTNTHNIEYKQFTNMQSSRLFKLAAGQYYQNISR
ncbi:MAG: tetratricopeptide repeat protein [Bacteroidota bacterium]